MFAKTIVLSDSFLDMPASARCLYFTLGMFADDDGFVNAPRGIMRQCGASDDDMKILVAKRFVLLFESGVIVIKHWRINNYLQKDRIQPTKCVKEKALLTEDKNGGYSMVEPPLSEMRENVYTEVYTQNRVISSNTDKHNYKSIPSPDGEDKCEIVPDDEMWFEEFWKKYPKKVDKIPAKRAFKKKCVNESEFQTIMNGLNLWLNVWKDPQYIPYPSKWLNNERYLETPAVTQEANKDPYSFLPFHS